jgi:tetratricopeptide (TPR) repeat protein/SAM-dependent methyltransferase
MKKPSRNEPCPCNSGRKYKHCCQKQDEARQQALSSSAPAVPQVLDIAIRHHRAGNLHQAENLYRQILHVAPNHPGALHFLGLVAKQSGQLEAALELIGKSIACEPAYAEAHANLGNVLSQLGRTEVAIESYRKALSLKPDLAEAHANLGNALKQQRRFDEAVASYGRALALKPDFAELHNNLGNILYEQGKRNEAAASYRSALRYRPDFAEAHNNLGNMLNELGKREDAVTHYRKALASRPAFPEACNNLGNALNELGKADEAIASYRAAITHRPHYAGAHKNLGNLLRKLGDVEGAVASYQQALQFADDPEITEGFAQCIKNLFFTREIDGLRPLLARALSTPWARPAELANPAVSLLKLDPDIGRLIQRVNRAWPERLSYRELFGDTEFPDLVSSRHPGDQGDAAGATSSSATRSSLPPDLTLVSNDLLFRCLLENTPVCDIELERFLTMARHVLLDIAISASPAQANLGDSPVAAAAPREPAERGAAETFATSVPSVPCDQAAHTVANEQAFIFYCALARQCLINEYIFECTNEECGKVEALRKRISAALDVESPVSALWVVAFAAYHPLIDLPSRQTLLGLFPNIPASGASSSASDLSGSSAAHAVAALLAQQVREPLEEQKNRSLIPCLTPVAESSRPVQRQYEQNPYPRWVKLPAAGQRVSLDEDLRRRFPFARFQPTGPMSPCGEGADGGIDILVAGCGTGQHSIATGRRYRNARVLAIDLSLASLCYAKRKTDESDLENITYAQADIMALDPAAPGARMFDLIESVGVLHHLADPLAGWRKLLSLLRPGGFMRLGFYSALARQNEMAGQDFGRNFLASFGREVADVTPQDIRMCRQAMMMTGNTGAFRQVLSARDFYTTSECRDLLFHVQENCYTLPQIKEYLAQLDLSLIGFSLDSDIMARYAQLFPHDSTQTDLDSWHLFETRNPDTFTGMYQFWVQKT